MSVFVGWISCAGMVFKPVQVFLYDFHVTFKAVEAAFKAI